MKKRLKIVVWRMKVEKKTKGKEETVEKLLFMKEGALINKTI